MTEPQRARATVTRSCMVDLTPPEIQHYGEQLAGAKILRDDITAQAKAKADDFKGQIAVKTAEIDKMARLVSDKKELRPVECFRELHPNNRVVIIRADTGEQVASHTADLVELSEFRAEAEMERKRRAKAAEKDEPEPDVEKVAEVARPGGEPEKPAKKPRTRKAK